VAVFFDFTAAMALDNRRGFDINNVGELKRSPQPEG